ncbi:hypothetical protein GCM10020295_35890 [Streptomyces cinereospinus]
MDALRGRLHDHTEWAAAHRARLREARLRLDAETQAVVARYTPGGTR